MNERLTYGICFFIIGMDFLKEGISSMQMETASVENRAGFTVRDMTKMAVCLAFCMVSAFISFPLPMTPGLVTALTIALDVTAFVLSPKLTFITVLAYVILGAVGLPVFPGGTGGLGRLLGPTGGFYIGWPFVCAIVSVLAKRRAMTFRWYALVAVVVGIPLTYVGGILSMMIVMQIDLGKALMMAAVPFIPGDIMKALLSAFIGVRVNKMLARQ